MVMQFQFTHPGRGATGSSHNFGDINLGFNSRTPGGVRLLPFMRDELKAAVSIHAPREGCDDLVGRTTLAPGVSIHAPREGCDRPETAPRLRPQSFNSRTPGGVRLEAVGRQVAQQDVSIHAPREGCDCTSRSLGLPRISFNSRTPGGVRRNSSHYCAGGSRRFNSRTPGGVRPTSIRSGSSVLKFQFTHPGRGATLIAQRLALLVGVSIHAPREGCDYRLASGCYRSTEFQFTHPGRGATLMRRMLVGSFRFQFTHPGRGATLERSKSPVSIESFNSRTPGGVRLMSPRSLPPLLQSFNSRTPGGVRQPLCACP